MHVLKISSYLAVEIPLFFPKRPIHNYTRVWKNNRESVVHVISIDLLFIRDALGYNSECASSNKGFLMRWMVTVMPELAIVLLKQVKYIFLYSQYHLDKYGSLAIPCFTILSFNPHNS